MRTNYLESNIEKDIDTKNHYGNKNRKDPISIREALSTIYVDALFNDPTLRKNNGHVDFNDKSLDNVSFVKVNIMPAVGQNLTAKYLVDQAISNSVD